MKEAKTALLGLAIAVAARSGAWAQAKPAPLTDAQKRAAELLHEHRHGGAEVPAVPPVGAVSTVSDEGPAAALAFERASRGSVVNPRPRTEAFTGRPSDMRLPEAKPVAIKGLKNIIPMTPQLWTPEQLEADFKKNKTAEQEGILFFLKTEYCHQNSYRGCAVTTAALEKRSTPVLKKFRVYAVWVELLNPDRKIGPEHAEWLDTVTQYYRFDQGPGANIYAIMPAKKQRARSDAYNLGLFEKEFEANQGATPKLEAWLNELLKK